MALFQCDNCGCVENSAKGFYALRNVEAYAPDEYLGKKLCSVCGPTHWKDGTKTGFGKWHGIFPRKYFRIGSLFTNSRGNVALIESLAINEDGKEVSLNDGNDMPICQIGFD